MTKEEFFDALYGDDENWKNVTEAEIYDQSRWSIYKSQVMQRISDGKYFEFWWGEGATEMQDGQDEPCGYFEVEPKEVTVTNYIQVKFGEGADLN